MNATTSTTDVKTVAQRVGNLCEAYLSPPYLGGMAGGSQMEADAIDRWRDRLGKALAMELIAIRSTNPAATKLIEFLQYRLRFAPGVYPSTEATPEAMEVYRSNLSGMFR